MASTKNVRDHAIDELRSILPAWNTSRDSHVRLLSLSENAVYLVVSTVLRQPFIVRVHRSGYNTKSEIESELSWVRALGEETNVKLPEPILGQSGTFVQELPNGISAVAFGFVKGRHPKSEDDILVTLNNLGAIAAQFHRHARIWERPTGFARKIWDFPHCLGNAAIWGNWRDAPGLSAKNIVYLEPIVSTLKKRLEMFGCGPERFGLVHGDMKAANVLITDVGFHVLDFDDCGYCWFLYDYGCAMTGLDVGPAAIARTQAWVSGYRQVADLSQEDEGMLPTFSLLRRFMTMAWSGSHTDSPNALDEFGAQYSMETLVIAEEYLNGHSR
jgi:Ser/Thr protein kinase RdoA (MazF antagonist)